MFYIQTMGTEPISGGSGFALMTKSMHFDLMVNMMKIPIICCGHLKQTIKYQV